MVTWKKKANLLKQHGINLILYLHQKYCQIFKDLSEHRFPVKQTSEYRHFSRSKMICCLLPKNSDNHHEIDKADTLQEDENPLDLLRFNSQGTMYQIWQKQKKLVLPLEKEKSHPRYYMTNIVKSLPFLVSFQKKWL